MKSLLKPLGCVALGLCATSLPAQEAAEPLAGTPAAVEPETTETEAREPAPTPMPEAATTPTADLSDLRADIATLRDELRQALTTQGTASKQAATQLADLNRTVADLDKRLQRLESDYSALAGQVGQAGEGSETRILSALNADPNFRQDFARSITPKAAVRFYNGDAKELRMNVNGTWYNLKPGSNTIRVPYGPVAVSDCDKKNPGVYTQWTPVDNGFLMVFDVGTNARR